MTSQHPEKKNEKRASDASRDGATFLALGVVVFIGCSLLAFMAVVIPGLSGVLGVIGFLMFTIVFHYVVWGRWMSRRSLAEEDDAD